MLSSAATAALRDIAHHVDLAIHFTVGFDYEAFVADPRTGGTREILRGIIARGLGLR